ncbi:rod-binding protein [Bdellovibrio sp. NC01]|uniref:rod-binding protein n=1 Tax=Bdellovibrio sp. NC01 TaxID=2220073 RepID=UPI001FF071FC|nr:rod-binding protein [Bdellovibrio sp. NC01]
MNSQSASAQVQNSNGNSQVAAVNSDGTPAAQVDRSKFMKMPSRFMTKPQQKDADTKLHEVSEMYEKHFLREMMKAMRSTVHESGFIQVNQAEKIFREQLDDHYVDKWSEKGGIGLSKMIYEQLVEKFGVQMGIKKSVAKPAGPLPLDERSNYSAHQFRHPGKKQALSYRIDKLGLPQGTPQEKPEVKSPWDGVLLGSKTLADSQTMVEIEHDNGLKSQMVFKGALSKISTGEKIQAGETLGVLSPESKSLYWTVESDQEPGPQSVSE